MQPDGYIELPTPDGLITLPVYTVTGLRYCTWVLADGSDADVCGRAIMDGACGRGHVQIGGAAARNFAASELS
jgi:hypothetical protein